MTSRSISRIVLALLVLAGAGIIAAVAYNAGIAAAGAPAGTVGPWGYGWRGGWGFGFLGFLFPLFFILLIVLLVRSAFWAGGPRGRYGPDGGYGSRGWYGSAADPDSRRRESDLEDWHRRMHGEPPRAPGRGDEPPTPGSSGA